MTPKNYQQFCTTLDRDEASYDTMRIYDVDGKHLQLMHMGLGLVGEAGEVAELIKKHIFYGKTLDIAALKSEIGDVLWYVSGLLTAIDSSFEEVMELNAAKLSKRYPNGYSNAAALSRADMQEEAKK